ncbi:hypothetical protein BDV3_003714 [Batrachochytrium dendrobatidis]|nr:hypothetical protein QVD99_004008 [Batrachochytrium dendrobatidis]
MSVYRNAIVNYAKSIQNKGLFQTAKEAMYIGQPKTGTLVGTDKFGNKYYENPEDMQGRNRWVFYKRPDFDATQAPPEWHQWLHRISDDIPTEKTLPKPFYAQESRENMTGTRGAFKTYNTTVSKITAWEPKVSR